MNETGAVTLTVGTLCIIAFVVIYGIRFGFFRNILLTLIVSVFLIVAVIKVGSSLVPSFRPYSGIPMPPDGKIYRAILETDLYDDRQIVRFYYGTKCVFYGEASSTPEKTILPFGVEGIPGERWQFDIYAVRCLDGARKVKMQALPVTAGINIRAGDEFIIFDIE